MFKMETDPESSAEINEFILGWTNPKMQLPIFFNELLQRKELIDVTLSAEGRFFGAHRLILSAYSPYFRQLFAQIPSDQNAYVVLANVSASILNDLITFIYCGEVKVRRENLSELLEAGQLLNIKGLSNVNHSPAVSKSKPNTSSQLNSRTTIKNNDDPMKVQATSVDVHQEQEPMVNPSNDFMENYDDLKPNGFEINNNNICDGVSNTIPEKGTHGMAGLDKKILHGKRPMSVIHFPRLLSDSIHATKLSKLSNDCQPMYTIKADIRLNEFGRENLYYKGFKFYRQVIGLKHTRWICMNHSNRRCRAAMSTTVVNRTTMMKILNAEHSHA